MGSTENYSCLSILLSSRNITSIWAHCRFICANHVQHKYAKYKPKNMIVTRFILLWRDPWNSCDMPMSINILTGIFHISRILHTAAMHHINQFIINIMRILHGNGIGCLWTHIYKMALKNSQNYCLLHEMVKVGGTLCYQNLEASLKSCGRLCETTPFTSQQQHEWCISVTCV